MYFFKSFHYLNPNHCFRDEQGGSQGEVDLIDEMGANENEEEVEGKVFKFFKKKRLTHKTHTQDTKNLNLIRKSRLLLGCGSTR